MSAKYFTIENRIEKVGGESSGFDYLRIGLAVLVLAWHTISSVNGLSEEEPFWNGPLRPFPAILLPMFFALSGFLVARSLERNPIHRFILLRILRIVPALTLVTLATSLGIGLVFTTIDRAAYLSHPDFWRSLLNIVGWIHYSLPGVFIENGRPAVLNGQLWTIPFEYGAYVFLVILGIAGLNRRPLLIALALFGLTAFLTLMATGPWPINPLKMSGRMLTISFIAGTMFYLARRHIPYSHALGFGALALSIALLSVPATLYLAAIPVAYLTLWIGLMTPPRIPFGDLSYGVYLCHFPIQKIYVHVLVNEPPWWSILLFSLPVSLAVALLSWRLVERPILSHKHAIIGAMERVASRWRGGAEG